MKAGISHASTGAAAQAAVSSPPEHLTLAVIPDNAVDALAELLGHAGLHGSSGASHTAPALHVAELGQKPVELARRIVETDNAHLLLAYRDPVPVTAAAIAQGVDPTEATVQWLEEARTILAAFRRARRRIFLFESGAALASPEDFISQLNERLGLSLRAPAETPAQAQPADQDQQQNPDPVYVLMAESALRQDAAARRASAELQAGAVPLAALKTGPQLDISATFHTYRKKSEEPIRQVNGLKEENGVLLSQLQQVQEQLQTRSNQNKQLQEEIDALKKKLAKAADQSADQSEVNDLKEENDLLLQQLHHVQEELERYYLENQDLNANAKKNKDAAYAHEKQAQKLQRQIQRMQATIDNKQRRIDYMLASRSWKITAPMRGFLKLFKRS